jgi:hypothetical protein
LLPNRAAAMTTIPTEIVFDGNLAEPQLILDPEFISIFEETIKQLNRKIQTIGQKEAEHRISDFPHLQNLLQRIQKPNQIAFAKETKGRQKIRQILTDINDLIRLCNWIVPRFNPLSRLSKIPRIEAPFVPVESNGNQENTNRYLGKLVLVDTPGPNEAMEEKTEINLYEIVTWQLRRSLAVLVVLDFTSLKTEAAEKIKQEVRQISEYIGKNNLYILVNKIDQRKEGDPMTSERIQELVESEFGVPMSGNIQCFFEISARQAFCAINFLQEYQKHDSGTSLSEMNQSIVRSLAQEVLGIDWEEDLEEATPNFLYKKAKKLWSKSGFQPFLKGVVDVLIAKAAPKSMNSANNLVRNRLQEISDFCNLKLSTQKSNVEQVKKTLYDLQSNQELSQASRDILEELKSQKLQSVRQQLECIREELVYRYQGDILKQEIKQYLLTSNVQLDTHYFSSKQAAEIEAARAERCLQSYQEEVLQTIVQTFDNNLQYNLDRYIHPQLQAISAKIQEAQASIHFYLGVNLYWQPPELYLGSIFEDSPSLVENLEPRISIWGFLHNLFSSPFQYLFEIPKVDKVYTLKLKNINSFRENIENAINSLFDRMSYYVDETLPNSFQEYADKVNGVLQSYIDSLENSIYSKSKSKEELETIEQNLEFLLQETEQYLKEAEVFRCQIEEFL